MAHPVRFVPPGYWLHLWQAGQDRREIFRQEADRRRYLLWLDEGARRCQVQVLGYCLMPDHVHLVARGKYPGAISAWMGSVHGRFAQSLGTPAGVRFWQGRFRSCPVDEGRLRSVLRYVELNSVRAGLVAEATRYEWSSAGAHAGESVAPGLLNREEFALRFTPAAWRQALASPQSPAEAHAIREATRHGHPLGAPEFLAHLEAEFEIVIRRGLALRASAGVV